MVEFSTDQDFVAEEREAEMPFVELTAATSFDAMAEELAKLTPFPLGWMDAPPPLLADHFRVFKGLHLMNIRELNRVLREAGADPDTKGQSLPWAKGTTKQTKSK